MAPKQYILLPARGNAAELKSIEQTPTSLYLKQRDAIVFGKPTLERYEEVNYHIISPQMIGIEASCSGYCMSSSYPLPHILTCMRTSVMYWAISYHPQHPPPPNEALIRLTDGKSDSDLRGNILICKLSEEDLHETEDCNLEDDVEIIKQYLKWFPGE